MPVDLAERYCRSRRAVREVAPTLASALGVRRPSGCSCDPISEVEDERREALDGRPAARALVFCPDALGEMLLSRDLLLARRVGGLAPLRVGMLAETPPKTPVCFASMFSGLAPEAHGIRRYERPVLSCDTLFDSLARGGSRVAIVAVEGSSIDIIFRGRDLEYHALPGDREVAACACGILARDGADFVLAYQQRYDDLLHGRGGPFSRDALEAAADHVSDFAGLSRAMEQGWGDFDRLLLFAPDHGAHALADGRGDHCDDIPDDMEITHFWGFRKARGETDA